MPGIRFKVDGTQMKHSIAEMRRSLSDLGVSTKMTEKEIEVFDKRVGETRQIGARKKAFDDLTKSLGLSATEAELFAKKYKISLGKTARDKALDQMNLDIKNLGINSKATTKDLAKFQKQISRTIELDKKRKAFDSLTKSMGLSEKESSKFARKFGINLKSSQKGIVGFIKSISTAKKIMIGFVASYAAMKTVEFVKGSITEAARYQVLGTVMEQVGNNAGKTRAEMQLLDKQVQAAGISMTASRQAITQMTLAELDLTKAVDLARLAQHAAVVGNMNSSEAFQNLVRGIQSGQTEILKTMGINVNFNNGYKKLTATMGKNKKVLDEKAKVMSRLNTVLKEGEKRAGIYEAAMGDVGKKISSLPRYIKDLKTTVGEPFLSGLDKFVDQITLSLKNLREFASDPEIQSGLKSLSDIFFDIATSAALFAEASIKTGTRISIAITKPFVMLYHEADAALYAIQGAIVKVAEKGVAGVEKVAKKANFEAIEKQLERIRKKSKEVSDGLLKIGKESAIEGVRVYKPDFLKEPGAPKFFPMPEDTISKDTEIDTTAAQKIQNVIEKLKLELNNLSRNAVQQKVYNSLKEAGIKINTKQGQSISKLVVALESEKLKQQEVLNNEEFTNKQKVKSIEDWANESEAVLQQYIEMRKKQGVYQGDIDDVVKRQRLKTLEEWNKKQKDVISEEVAFEKKKSKGSIDTIGLTNRKLIELENQRLKKEKEINEESLDSFKTTTKQKRESLLGLYREIGDYSEQWMEEEEKNLKIQANEMLNVLGDTPENRNLINKLMGQKTREIKEKPKTAADEEKMIALRKDLVQIDMDELGYSQTAEELAKRRLDIYQQQYVIEEAKLDRMATGADATADEISAYNSELNVLSEINEQLVAQKKLLQDRSVIGGAREALKEYADEASNTGKQVSEIFTKAFTEMEDAFMDFIKTGKLEFSDLIDSISKDILRMMVRTNITAPLAGWLNTGIGALGSMFGGFGGGTGGSIPSGGLYGAQYQATGIHHTGKGPYESAKSFRMLPKDFFANAPKFHDGIGPNEQKAVIKKDEGVFTKGQMGAMAPISSLLKAMQQSENKNSGNDISISIPVTVNGGGNGMNMAAMKNDIEETVISIVRKYADA